MKKCLTFFLLIMLASCGGNDAQKKEVIKDSAGANAGTDTITSAQARDSVVADFNADTTSNTGGTVNLGFNLQKGKQYQYAMDFSLSQQNGQQTSTSGMKTVYTVEVTGGTEAVKTLSATYNRLVMYMNFGGRKMEISSDPGTDTKDPMTGMAAKMFQAIRGKSFTMTVNRRGEIQTVSGFDAIADAMVKEMDLPEDAKARMLANFKNQFNDRAVKDMFAQSFDIFPDKPVKVGDSWKRNHSISGKSAQDMVTVYTLRSINKDRVTIDAVTSSDVKNFKSSIQQKSRMIVDVPTGLVIKSSFDQKMEGQINMRSSGVVTGKVL